MSTPSDDNKIGKLNVIVQYDDNKPTEGFGTTFSYVPGTAPLLTDVTLSKATDSTDLTFDIPYQFDDSFAVPISGPAFIQTGVMDTAAGDYLYATNPYNCTATGTVLKLTVLESSLRVNLHQAFTTCPADSVAQADFATWWGDFATSLKDYFDADTKNSQLVHTRLGCHTKPNTKIMTCYAGFKVPANATEQTEVLLKVFKESEKVKRPAPSRAAVARKAGSMGAAPSTATCNFGYDETAKAYKVTYTNKSEDEAICFFMVENKEATEVEEYTFSETDAILLTKANKKETDDDTTKFALSAGYVNSSWSILTIILIVGGIVVILVVALIWWFRPTQVESEEED